MISFLLNFYNYTFVFLGVNCQGQSCANELEIENQPQTIFTNTTSFVGVKAIINPVSSVINFISSKKFFLSNKYKRFITTYFLL